MVQLFEDFQQSETVQEKVRQYKEQLRQFPNKMTCDASFPTSSPRISRGTESAISDLTLQTHLPVAAPPHEEERRRRTTLK